MSYDSTKCSVGRVFKDDVLAAVDHEKMAGRLVKGDSFGIALIARPKKSVLKLQIGIVNQHLSTAAVAVGHVKKSG